MKNKMLKIFSITSFFSILICFNALALSGGNWIEVPKGNLTLWQFEKKVDSRTGTQYKLVTGTEIVTDNSKVNWYIKNGYLSCAQDSKGELITVNNKKYKLLKDGRVLSTFWIQKSNDVWNAYKDNVLLKDTWVNNFSESIDCQTMKYYTEVHRYYLESNGNMAINKSLKIGGATYTFNNQGVGTPAQDRDVLDIFLNTYQAGWIRNEHQGYVLKDTKGNLVKNRWTNKKGDKYSSSFNKEYAYRSDENGKMIQGRTVIIDDHKYEFSMNGDAKDLGKVNANDKKEDKKQKETPKQDDNSADLNTKPDGSLPKNPNEGWVDLGNGDWALYLAGSYIKGQWFSENATNNWYYLNSKGIMLRNCYVYPADSLGSKLTLDSTKAVTTASGEPIKYYFNNNGAWSLSNVINTKDGTDLSQLPPAQALSFLTKQEKKDIKNKKDEDVENEIAIPIEIYTKDQFYKGKFSTGQMSENEYLTNGYYIYNKGNGKYTLYKTNNTIGKTSKAIKSNTTLAKITDYLDDNDIEKSAEIKAKEGSSSSKDKSSSKISKKITVTIKSGYKTKDKQSITIDYEGSYTLPTFEEMNWEEKPKYTFSHWAIGSKKYNPGDTIDNIKSKKTITAKWKKN